MSTGLTELYRHYGAEGALLYIGVSINTLVRLSQQEEAKRLFQDAKPE
jgi:hypothetical protein